MPDHCTSSITISWQCSAIGEKHFIHAIGIDVLGFYSVQSRPVCCLGHGAKTVFEFVELTSVMSSLVKFFCLNHFPTRNKHTHDTNYMMKTLQCVTAKAWFHVS